MLKFTTIILIFYTLACLFLYFKQRDLLFYPTPNNSALKAPVLWIENDREKLKTWRLNGGERAIIYFGGNAESVEYNIPEFKQAFNDFTVYLVNYRGYGGSSGSPSQTALFDDALALYDEIQSTHSSISLIGRSLGSGVACFLASERKVDKLALITPYDSIRNVAQSHYPLFPVKWLLKDSFDSLSCARGLTNSILVLMAEKDRVIPMKHSQNLLQSFTHERVDSHIIKNTSHNDISSDPLYLQLLEHFFSGKRSD